MATDIEIHALEEIALRSRLDVIYAEHTGQPLAKIHTHTDRDRFYTADEVHTYGVRPPARSKPYSVPTRQPQRVAGRRR
ncbi:MAG: ATP-dependent Clp protease proteolytic subunit [Solirubrobacteraceae bacterium]